jgi:hypothetical protein
VDNSNDSKIDRKESLEFGTDDLDVIFKRAGKEVEHPVNTGTAEQIKARCNSSSTTPNRFFLTSKLYQFFF